MRTCRNASGRGLGGRVLDDRREALPDADAQRRQAVAQAALGELVGQRPEQARARAAERVADGDRAAVDVELGERDAELARRGEHLAREGLVDLDEIDVV